MPAVSCSDGRYHQWRLHGSLYPVCRARSGGRFGAGAAHDRIARVQVLATDHQRTSVKTNEKALRDRDRSFDGLLAVEGLDVAAVRELVPVGWTGRQRI